MFNVTGLKIVAAGLPGWLSPLQGIIDIIWMLLQLVWLFFQVLFGLGALSSADIYNAAHKVTVSIVALVSDFLLMSPFDGSILSGAGGIQAGSEETAKMGLEYAFDKLGMNGLPGLCLEAGLALTMICFFYGFAESSVNLEKTNIQLIISRIIRWIVAVGLVTSSYLLLSYLFLAFRSLYEVGRITEGRTAVEDFFGDLISQIKPTTSSNAPMIDTEALMSEGTDKSVFDTYTITDSWGNLDHSPIGAILLFFGLVKLMKEAIKFVIEQVPAFAKVMFYFVCAPFGLAMYASPETQQKANSYLRMFGAATLTNLFKVGTIALATFIVTKVTFPVGDNNVCILNLIPIFTEMLGTAFNITGEYIADGVFMKADIAKNLAFLMTSGGLLGYTLYFKMITKASEMSERLAHEILA